MPSTPADGKDAASPLATEEVQIRSAGRLALIIGGIFAGLILFVASVWRYAFGDPLPYEWTLAILAGSTVAICYGLAERLQRSTRERLQTLEANQRLLLAQRDVDDERATGRHDDFIEYQRQTTDQLAALAEFVQQLKPELDEQRREESSQSFFRGVAVGARDQLKATGTERTGDVRWIRKPGQPPTNGSIKHRP